MVLIPDDFQSQTEVQPAPGAGLGEIATPQAFGEPTAAALGVAGEVATKLHYDAVAAANKVAVNNAMNQIDAAGQKALRDPQTGLLYQQTGAQAPQAAEKTLSGLQEQVGKVRAGLVNDQQREDFDASSRHITDQWAAHSDAYVGTQLEDHTKNVAMQTMQLADKAIADDPDSAQARIASVKGSVETTAAALHYVPGSDDYKMFVQMHSQEAETQLSKTAVQAYIAQNRPMDAQRYLQKYGDSIPVGTRDELMKQAQGASTEQQGQATAMDFLNQDKLDGGVFDRAKFNEQVENDPRMQDEALRKATVAHGEALMGQHDVALREAQDRTLDQVYGAIHEPTNGGAIPPEMRAAMTTLTKSQQVSLNEESERMVDALNKHVTPVTDSGVWAQNHDTLINDPQKLTSMSTADIFAQYGKYYSPGDLKEFVGSVDEARKGVAESQKTADGLRTEKINASVNKILATAGPDSSGVTLEDPQAAAFYKTVTQNVQTKLKAMDKPPDDAGLQKMIDGEINDQIKPVDVETPGQLWGTNTASLPLWQVPVKSRAAITMPMAQIPSEKSDWLRKEIAANLSIPADQVDEPLIRHAYAARLRNDPDAYTAIIHGNPGPAKPAATKSPVAMPKGPASVGGLPSGASSWLGDPLSRPGPLE